MKTVNTLPVISPSRGSIYKSPTSTKEKFRFPPISDTGSFHKKDLDKHIRNNDVSQVLKESRSPIVEQRDIGDVQQDEVKETSNNLLFLRKKYNEARETCVKMEQDMNKTRIDNDKLKTKENFMQNDISECHNKLTDLRNALNLQQIRIEEAWENNRVYAQMLDRLKRDRLTDKMKYASLENALHHELGQLDTETKVAKKALQFGIQTKIVFNGVMRHIEEEDKKRQKDLSIFEKTLTAQEEADMKRAERLERSKEVAETAQSELKDSNEHQWREVEKVHKFLNFFLKRKIEREIRQYETVEKAYQKIKASTGLSDTREIVNKFINREQTYSELLISIADYEKRIADLQKINEERKAKIQSLKEASLPSDKFKEEDEPKAKPNLLESYKNLEVIGENYKDTKLVVEKTYGWVMQSLIKMDKAKKIVNNRYYELHPKDRLAEGFLKLIETVKNDLTEIKEQDVEKILDEIDNTKVDEVVKNETFVARNMRVKPLNTRERMRSIESPTHSKRSFIENEPIEIEIEPNTKEEHEAIESYRVQVKTRILEDPIKLKK